MHPLAKLLTGRIEKPWSHGCLGIEKKYLKSFYRIGQDVWQEEKMEEIEMRHRRIKEVDRGKVTNLLLSSVKIVSSLVHLTRSPDGQNHKASL